jgi:hypothetical protein
MIEDSGITVNIFNDTLVWEIMEIVSSGLNTDGSLIELFGMTDPTLDEVYL